MIFVIGEVLYDVFPDCRRIGGAPFNFAFHLIRMGFAVRLITRVGADADGDCLLEFIRCSGFSPDHIQIDETHRTGRVMVYPDREDAARFDIVRNAAYDYIEYTDAVSQLLRTPPRLVYFGTLIQRTPTGRQTMQKIFRSRSPETIFFYDINLRPDCYSREVIRQSLTYADILKLNDEELEVVRNMFDLSGDTASVAARLIRDYSLSLLALTKGNRGSEIFTATDHIKMPASSGHEYVDTVGAGDAFAAVLAAGILKKMNIRLILPAAADFAGRICGLAGAVPESGDFYKSMMVLPFVQD